MLRLFYSYNEIMCAAAISTMQSELGFPCLDSLHKTMTKYRSESQPILAENFLILWVPSLTWTWKTIKLISFNIRQLAITFDKCFHTSIDFGREKLFFFLKTNNFSYSRQDARCSQNKSSFILGHCTTKEFLLIVYSNGLAKVWRSLDAA